MDFPKATCCRFPADRFKKEPTYICEPDSKRATGIELLERCMDPVLREDRERAREIESERER